MQISHTRHSHAHFMNETVSVNEGVKLSLFGQKLEYTALLAQKYFVFYFVNSKNRSSESDTSSGSSPTNQSSRNKDDHRSHTPDHPGQLSHADHIPLEGYISFRKTSRGEIEDRSAQRKPIKSFDQSKHYSIQRLQHSCQHITSMSDEYRYQLKHNDC